MVDIIICEDNPVQRKFIQNCIENYIIEQDVDGYIKVSTDNPDEVFQFVKNNNNYPKIYFLDINLNQDINGIELATKIRDLDTTGKIIFITTEGQMLPLTFEYMLEATDFIEKSTPENIRNRIQKVLSCIFKRLNSVEDKMIEIKIGAELKFIPLKQIMFFETSPISHKLILNLTNDKIEFYGKLKNIINLSDDFIKVHSSFVVNKNSISSIDYKNFEINFIDGQKCFASRRFIKNLKQI